MKWYVVRQSPWLVYIYQHSNSITDNIILYNNNIDWFVCDQCVYYLVLNMVICIDDFFFVINITCLLNQKKLKKNFAMSSVNVIIKNISTVHKKYHRSCISVNIPWNLQNHRSASGLWVNMHFTIINKGKLFRKKYFCTVIFSTVSISPNQGMWNQPLNVRIVPIIKPSSFQVLFQFSLLILSARQ